MIDALLTHAQVGPDASTQDVIAPFTGLPIAVIPMGSALDVEASVSALRQAIPAWSAMPVRERAAIMLRFHDLVLARRAEGMDLAQWETGKSRLDAQLEIADVAIVARHYARDAARLLRSKRHRGVFPVAVGVREHARPKGVVGVIAPWNYPLTLASSDAIPALLAGNTVLLKPDPQTTLCALWILSLLREAGLPDDVMHVVPGDGPVVGAAVVEHVDYVQFTGSSATGRIVAERCGRRLIGCSLELGGKNAMIIRADADIAKAVDIAERASFSNAGQLCISMERIYVHHAIIERFTAAFVERVNAMRIATGVGWGADMGTLTSAAQLAKIAAHVDDAKSKGATVLSGGNARPELAPFAFEPTVLTDVTDDMALCAQETFGPVVAIYSVADDDEAVRRANQTSYGLNASVISADVGAAQRLAGRLHAGTVNINEGFGASWGSTRAPMGGMGDSGLGRRHGDEGLLKYTEPQVIATQRALGFGPQFGLDDQAWGDLLTRGLSLMKRAGLK